MKCRPVRDWLLHAENPGDLPHAPPGVLAHVRACAGCRRLLREVRQLEDNWRNLPLPAGVEAAKNAFLQQHAPKTLKFLPPRRWWPNMARFAVAAALLLCVGLASWLVNLRQTPAAETVLDQMIEWNAALSQAEDPKDKERIYKEKAREFAQLVKKGGVPVEQQELADKLLENANWLNENEDDPLLEADRFNELADEMIDKMEKSSAVKDEKALNQMAESYSRLAEKGINANLKQVKQVDKLKVQQQAELQKLLLKEQQRAEKLKKILQQSPPHVQQQLKHAISVTGNHSHVAKKKAHK